ncbi:hypothetical protein HIM_06357 [Hirsutella minnesotensis 3608]|uniref:1,3-beta-glucanosyltransferase n=1 Tax=Hirsutella minnesotensis 3608 TaxID=1043627 RepID=A0A0F7ZJF7_9HYPO|nr:hypothetical protein HIM_06357 [Hirsutella minnesotensis 3608]
MAPRRVLLSLLALTGSVMGEFQPIGSKFFYKNGTQFFMKGVAYQQDIAPAGGDNDPTAVYTDPLADVKVCERDIPYLQELGTNTIRTYAINPKLDHSGCMKLLRDAGIYVVSDLGQPSLSINRDDPKWNTELFNRYKAVISELAKYDNVIGFFAGNEVTNNGTNTMASAFVKAAVRDSKAYIKSNKDITRWLGVGYATSDHAEIRAQLAHYFSCDSAEDSVDFWGYNVYSWCGDNTFHGAGWDKQVDFFEYYPVPTFLGEYGCNEIPGGGAARKFQETEALYSGNMTGVFSGGIVYMYHQEANDYGLVKVQNGKVTKLDSFDALKKEVTKAKPEGVSMDSYKPAGKLSECPAVDGKWESHKELPPTPDESLCDCMVKSATCVPKPDLSPKQYGELFGLVCSDKDACAGIKGDAKSGVYGAYNMCSDVAKLTHVLDAYSRKYKGGNSCDWGGKAVTQKASAESACSPPPADKKPKKTDDSSAAHGISLSRPFTLGGFALNMYVLAAVGTGVAMVAL